MTLDDKHFDDKIRKSLEDLSPELDPDSWELLAQKLAAQDILHPEETEDALLDELVISGLSGLSASVPPSNWDSFEQKLNAAEAQELEEIDDLVSEKLRRLEVPYEPSHWQLMLRRIESELTLRGKLYKYKVAELALMLLLIFTIINLRPLDHFPVQFKLNPAPAAPAPSPNATLPPEIVPQPAPTPQKLMPVADNQLPPASPEGASVALARKTEAQPQTRNNTPPPGSLQNPMALVQSDSEKNDPAVKKEANPPITVPMVGSLVAMEIQTLETDENPDFQLPFPQIEKKKPTWRVSIYTASDINKVETPFDQTFGLPAYTSTAGGYGGGINISMKMNKWAFETGGLYSFKRYIPQPYTDKPFQPSSLFTEDFKGVQLDILQVPFNVQYHFVNHGKWRFYVLGGASLHMLLSPVYELERTWIVPPMPTPLLEGDCDTCLPSVKEFPKGLLDGGSFKENSYGTLNIGAGLERYLNPRWNIFVQPTYQHYITKEGVGPNDDKIYSMSIFIGAKVSLK
ncbi:MAG: hypothetical protein D6714_12915 [Bacteroidetes bacterium]|nr:MAG: hypothetical protein D6714_12915 [Bacteroidota bacterium]